MIRYVSRFLDTHAPEPLTHPLEFEEEREADRSEKQHLHYAQHLPVCVVVTYRSVAVAVHGQGTLVLWVVVAWWSRTRCMLPVDSAHVIEHLVSLSSSSPNAEGLERS